MRVLALIVNHVLQHWYAW